MISTNNASLNGLDKLSGAVNSPQIHDPSLIFSAGYMGRRRPCAAWNASSNYWADEDYELWNMSMVSQMMNTQIFGTYSRQAQANSSQSVNYSFYAPLASTFRIFPYMNSTAYYKNGVLQGTVNVGSYINISLAAGDRFSANQPIAIYPGAGTEEYEPAYSGLSGYKFMTRFDRYDPTTVYIFATSTTVANINVYVNGSNNIPVSNWGAPTYSTTNLSQHSMWSFSNVSANVLIESSQPICCVAYASSARDVRRLYPLTVFDKFGAFSTGGHILACSNASEGAVTATLVGYSSTNTTATNFTVAFNPASIGGAGTFVDDTGNPTSAGSWAGPVVRLKDTTGYSLFTAESQGDGDGSEMVQFVDEDWMQERRIAYMPDASDWVGVIAYGGTSNDYVHEWGNAGWKVRSWRFTQVNTSQDVQYAYCQRMFSSTTAPPLFVSDISSNAFFWDKNGQYEDIQFSSNDSDYTTSTAVGWPAIYYFATPFGTAFNPGDPEIANLCAGAQPTAFAYGDGPDANSSQYMYANTSQDNWLRTNGLSGQKIFFLDSPGGGNNIYSIQNYDSSDNELLYEHVVEGICEGEGGGPKSDIRLKENITQIDISPSGIPIYTFNYIGGSDLYEGVMAQDLLELGFNDAVGMGDDGYYFVRYDLIDVDMKKL